MRRLLSFLAAPLLGLGGCVATADVQEDPLLQTGSTLYWVSAYDGSTDQFQEKLVASGTDFDVYKTISEYMSEDPSDYFALFSGIDFRSCDGDMPDAEERARIAALWPLEEGKTAEVSLEDGSTIKVGAATEFFLMGEVVPAYQVTIDYQNTEEAPDESLTVLADPAVTVEIDWDDESQDRVTLITKGQGDSADPIDLALLGNCASLLEETQE